MSTQYKVIVNSDEWGLTNQIYKIELPEIKFYHPEFDKDFTEIKNENPDTNFVVLKQNKK